MTEEELLRVRSELEQREQLGLLLEGLIEALADGVVALDFRGEVVHLSDSLREPEGRGARADHASGEVLPPAVLRALRRQIRRATAQGSHRFDLEWEREETGLRSYRVIATAGERGRGEMPASAGERRLLTLFAFYDRTREQALEAELAQARKLAALGQMAATVAHELRNPLAAIQGFATLLRRDLEGQPDAVRQVECILKGVEGADRIVSDLLEYCRPLELRADGITMEALLAESLTALHASPRWRTGVRADLQIDPGLRPLRGDRRLLLQALANLYDNALDAMEQGGMLSVRARALGGPGPTERIRLVVRDTGKGLTAEEAARVFEPFYTTKPRGTGLGLAIVRRTVEAHGGQVHVVSAPGRGTSVVLDLPSDGVLRQAGAQSDPQAHSRAHSQAHPRAHSRAHPPTHLQSHPRAHSQSHSRAHPQGRS